MEEKIKHRYRKEKEGRKKKRRKEEIYMERQKGRNERSSINSNPPRRDISPSYKFVTRQRRVRLQQ